MTGAEAASDHGRAGSLPGSPLEGSLRSLFAKADPGVQTPSPTGKKQTSSAQKDKPPEKDVHRGSLKAFMKEKRARSPSPKPAPPPKKQASLAFMRVSGPSAIKDPEVMVIEDDEEDAVTTSPDATPVTPAIPPTEEVVQITDEPDESCSTTRGMKRSTSRSTVDTPEAGAIVGAAAAGRGAAAAPVPSASKHRKKNKGAGRGGAAGARKRASASQVAQAAAKLSGLQEASTEEQTGIWGLAASFRAFLQKEKKLAESAAVEHEKVLCALFEEDEKSFEAMASLEYENVVALIAEQEEAELRTECLGLYREFWPHRARFEGSGGLRPTMASETTKYEAKLRHSLQLFPDWGLFVRNSRKGELVTITAPDGRVWNTVEEAKEPIRAERERRVNALKQRSQALVDEHAPTLLSIIRRERSSFVLRDAGSSDGTTLSTRRLVGVFVQSRELVNERYAFERCDHWLQHTKDVQEPECCFCAWSRARQCWAFSAVPNPDEAPERWWGSGPDCGLHEQATDLVKALAQTSGRWSRHCEGDESSKIDAAVALQPTCPDELLKATLEFLRQRQRICQLCNAFPDDDEDPFAELESGNKSMERAQWEVIMDVPDATPEEIKNFPRLLCTYERYLKEHTSLAESSVDGYVKALKAIFEDTPKCPEEMGTSEFFKLVKQDPANRLSNGQRQASIQKLRQFMEAWRGKPLDELPKDEKKAIAYELVIGRERDIGLTAAQAEVVNDIELPLEQIMDHQDDWSGQLRLLIDGKGFILQDIEAAGYLPRRKDLRELLRQATPEEWAELPKVLKTFEAWLLQQNKMSPKGPGIKTSVDIIRDMFCSEALPPTEVATSRGRALARGDFKQDAAVKSFSDFWKQHKGPLLSPSAGIVAFGRSDMVPPLYRTCSLEEATARAKRRREVYANGKVPLDWTVEIPSASGPLCIRDNSGGCYATEDEAAQAHLKQLEQRRQEARAEDMGRKRSSGFAKMARGEAISASREDGGRNIDSLRDLVLRRHEWQVIGVRGTGGALLKLGDEATKTLQPEEVSVVLRMDIKETTLQLERQCRLEWKVPEDFKVTVKPRLSANLILVTDTRGRTFMSKYQLDARERLDSEQKRRQQVALKLPEALQALDSIGEGEVLELRGCEPGSKAARCSGLYCLQQSGRDGRKVLTRFRKLAGLNLAADEAPLHIKIADAGCEDSGDARWVVHNESHVKRPFLHAPANGKAADITETSGTWMGLVKYSASQGTGDYAPAPGVKIDRLTQQQALGRLVDILHKPAVVCDFCCKPAAQSGAGGTKQLVSPGAVKLGTPVTLRQMVSHMMEKVLAVPETKEKLQAISGRRVRIGSMCSGTDSPILALRAISMALECHGMSLEVEHSFSCEIDKDKQGFLCKNFSFGALFNDVCELSQDTAKDVLSGKEIQVPSDLDVIIAGFSCKDLSGMNRNRKHLEEMGTSGTTLQGCLDYISRHRPRIVIFENVRNIATRDSDTGLRPVDLVMEALRRLGYQAGWKFLDTCNYYLPQMRARIWMWGYRVSDAPDPNYRPVVSELSAELVELGAAHQKGSADSFRAGVNDKVHKLLERLQHDAEIHFDDLLLPDDNSYVQREIGRAMGRDCRKVHVSDKAKMTWDVKHKLHRDSLKNRYSKPYTSYRGAPWLRTLNEREKQLCDINFQEVYEDRGIDVRQVPMVWELSQSAGRVPGTKTKDAQMHCAPCIVPGKLWHTTRRRFLLGREKLRFQGIFEEDLKDLDCVPEVVLGDLAGNAFSATVCAANLLAALLYGEL